MKKLTTIVCALILSSWSFAQKSEVKAIEKAVKNVNFADAKAAVSSAEALLGSMDDKTKAKFYFFKAQALYANGAGSDADIDEAIKSFDKLKDIETSMGKLKYTEQANEIKNTMLQGFLTKANAALSAKQYTAASKRFEKAYKMSPSDTTYLYYAASTAVNAQDYDTALDYYLQLKNMNYTGVKMNYYATNVETGQEDVFNNKANRTYALKAKLYNKPRDEMSESKAGEIVKNIALIYVAQGKNEKAIAAMADARAASPDDLGLLLSEANVHLEMGNRDKFKKLMEEATLKNPENAELQYNLGVLAADGDDPEGAKKYYGRAIELDPNYTDAYINMAVVILGGEDKIVEEMNGLGNSSADDRRYDELKAERTSLYKSAIPYLEKALEQKGDNKDAAKTLMNIYSAIGEMDKFKAMKEKVANMN